MIKGFTLLEMMLVIALLGFMLFMSLTPWQPFAEKKQIQQQLKKLHNTLEFARHFALLQHATVFVCPLNSNFCGKDWASGYGVFNLTKAGAILIHRFTGNPKVKIFWNRTSNKITFNSKGTLTGQNGHFSFGTLKLKHWPKKIYLSRTGRIRVADG